MNERESRIEAARERISDARLTAFFRAVRDAPDVVAVQIANDLLDQGHPLDALFYTGEDYGLELLVDRVSESQYMIAFGCTAGPDAGDGGEWNVVYRGDEVEQVHGGLSWVS